MAISSIFGSFDALRAYSFDNTLAGFLASAPSKIQIQEHSSKLKAAVKTNDSKENKQAAKNKPGKPEICRRPRFAPELDGVHCFETILPY